MSKRNHAKQNLPDAREMRKLADALEKFERETEFHTGVSRLSGGFAVAEMFNYDDDFFDIELKWGVQNDCENRVHIERYVVSRKTFKIMDANKVHDGMEEDEE